MKRLKTTASLMINAFAVVAVCLSTLTSASALTNPTANATVFDASGELKSCKIEYNVTENGRKGMRMRMDFEVSGLKGVDAKLKVRVQDEDDEYLKSKTAYADKDGNIEVSYSMNPGYETAVYDEIPIFLPYSEFALDDGEWNLKLDIDLTYEDGGLVKHLAYKEFVFVAPGSARDVTPEPTAEMKKVWLEQDVVEKRRRGMRLHLNFETTGLKNVDAKILVRIMRTDDSFLLSGGELSNPDGQFEAAYDMKPLYDPAVYEDVAIFIPYDELLLRKGTWQLKFDIDLNYANRDLVQHVAFHKFTLTK